MIVTMDNFKDWLARQAEQERQDALEGLIEEARQRGIDADAIVAHVGRNYPQWMKMAPVRNEFLKGGISSEHNAVVHALRRAISAQDSGRQ
jgi:hypothetical protein